MTFDQNSNVEVFPVPGHPGKVVLRASLLFGPDNNEPRWRYVPASVHRTTGRDFPGGPTKSFVQYGCFFRGGRGEQPINFTTKTEAMRFFTRKGRRSRG